MEKRRQFNRALEKRCNQMEAHLKRMYETLLKYFSEETLSILSTTDPSRIKQVMYDELCKARDKLYVDFMKKI